MSYTRFAGIFSIIALLVVTFLPVTAEARFRGDVAGWVPWWNTEEGVEAVIEQMDELDVVYLFAYEINEKGELISKVNLDEGIWKDLIDEAKDERVDIIPTVMWFDGNAIHEILHNKKTRQALVGEIEDMVDDMHFDGVNIDFEQKLAETIDDFSDFLKELKDALGRDNLSCAIEARIPPESQWREGEVPDVIEYANDYKSINRYCDWVEIMAYDQMRADLLLNKERQGVPYNPIADVDWVEKVLKLALEDIDEEKILVGIPTYGRAYDVTVAPDWYRDYAPVAALDYSRVLELADIYNVEIGRTEGGEGFISYFPNTSPYSIFNQLPTPEGTPTGYEAAAKALLVANVSGLEIPVRIVTFGDAVAAQAKIDLVEKYDLRGIAIFKLDEHLDKNLWKNI